MTHATPKVTRIAPIDTHDLRRRVLRNGRSDVDLEWPGDNADDTEHLGIVVDGVVVAISTWLIAPFPSTDERGVRLRGMATDPAFANRGMGTELLRSGLARARERGVTLAWANSRVTVLAFYQRAGFDVVGSVFTTEETGLPHQCVRLDLAPVSPLSI